VVPGRPAISDNLVAESRATSDRNNYDQGAQVSLGVGNDPGPRRVATLHVFAFQQDVDGPCGFQAQGTLWVTQ
jgi:hypothetical protein